MQRSDHVKVLWALAFPVYLELLSSVATGIVDTFWVARLGGAAVGAVALGTTLENMLLGVILVISAGATVLVANRTGQGDDGAVKRIVNSAWVLWAVLTPVIAIGGYFLRSDLVSLFTGESTGEQLRLTSSYMAFTFPGLFVLYAQAIVDSFFKGDKNTRTPMKMAMLANILNLLLDPLLIFGAGFVPGMGVAGASLATLIGRSIALGVSLVLLFRSSFAARIRQAGAQPSDAATMGQILRIGTPMAADFFVRMVAGVVLVSLISRFGVSSLAAYGIGTKVLLVITMYFYGLRQAASIHAARRMGEGAVAEVPVIGRAVLSLGVGVAAVAAVLLAAVAPGVVRIFTGEPAVIAATVVFLRYMAIYLIPLGCVVSLGGLFLGAGHSSSLLYVTLTGIVAQLSAAFAFSMYWQVAGVWTAMQVGACVQALLLLGLFRHRLLSRSGARSVQA